MCSGVFSYVHCIVRAGDSGVWGEEDLQELDLRQNRVTKYNNSLSHLVYNIISSVNGPRKQSSYLVGPPCSVQGQFISCKLVSIA